MRAKRCTTMKIWGKLSWGTAIILTSITVLSCFFNFGDSTSLTVVCGFAWTEVGVYTAAYAFKEKAANKQKIAVSLIKDLAEQYGLDSLAPIIQSVIQE